MPVRKNIPEREGVYFITFTCAVDGRVAVKLLIKHFLSFVYFNKKPRRHNTGGIFLDSIFFIALPAVAVVVAAAFAASSASSACQS